MRHDDRIGAARENAVKVAHDTPRLEGSQIVLIVLHGVAGVTSDPAERLGAELADDSVICNEAPDDEAVASCKALGAALA